MSTYPDYRRLLEKYMTAVGLANNGQHFIDTQTGYFRKKAGLNETDIAELRLISETIPRVLVDPDFETEEDVSSLPPDDFGDLS